MKLFHISDVLSITTGRLVSSRHVEGVYDILNFLTGGNLFTHQLPRAKDECDPWLRTQFPQLYPDDPEMAGLIEGLAQAIAGIHRGREDPVVAGWVEGVRVIKGLPELLPVYELGADMHTQIDPVEELRAMVGDDRVVVVVEPEERTS